MYECKSDDFWTGYGGGQPSNMYGLWGQEVRRREDEVFNETYFSNRSSGNGSYDFTPVPVRDKKGSAGKVLFAIIALGAILV